MADERRPPRRRRKRKRALFGVISFLFICGALLLGVSVFFNITVIKVEGNTRYSSEQVVEASGIKKGDNLFFVNKFDAISRIFSQLPYAETVTMKRDLPNAVVISVTDAAVAACIQNGSDFWLIDKSCKLMDKVGSDKVSGVVSVVGVTIMQPKVGQKLTLTDSGKAACLSQILTEITNRNMLKSVTKIDLTNVGGYKFDYLGRYNVKLGNAENISGKFKMLQDALNSNRISPVATGTIDLSQDNEARFILE